MSGTVKPVIIDTDPGIDDIVALIYALKTKLDVLGLTTVHGNSTITNVTRNAQYITDLLSSTISVYAGSSFSLDGYQYFAESSGAEGINGYKIPKAYKPHDISALDFMHRTLEKTQKKVTLLCLGPLTNIAILFNLYPHLVEKIDSLIVMGGVFSGKGNITPYAEFNAYCDPLALEVVLGKSAECQLPVTLIPAEVCRQVWLTKKELQKLVDLTGYNNLKRIIKPYIEYYLHNQNYGGFPGAIIYDLLVPVFFTNPEFFEAERGVIEVSVLHGEYYGKTTMIPDSSSNIQVVRKVDSEAVKKLFFESLSTK